MSLRDQLFSAAIINKKELRKSKLDAKKKRRQKQGNRKKKKQTLAEERERTELERREKIEELVAARKEREAEKRSLAKERQVNNIIRHHHVRFRKAEHPFWHLAADGHHLHKLWVPERLAVDLRDGKMGIAVEGAMDSSEPNYLVIGAAIVKRVQQIDAKRVLFFNKESPDPNDPSERLLGHDS